MLFELVTFGVTFIIFMDVGVSIVCMQQYGAEIVPGWRCKTCGRCVEHPSFCVSVWQILTHRCDDNLCQ